VYLGLVKSSHVAALMLLAAAGGCASGGDAIFETAQSLISRDKGIDTAQLNPNFRYLRVTIGGRVVLLALGYLDSHRQGTIEVWYSAEREVVRLQNGRVVGAVGLTTEWRNVVLPDLPEWSKLASTAEPFHWARTRDVMPGYRYGLRDSLSLRSVPVPGKTALQGLDARNLAWFEERFNGDGSSQTALPTARYAVQIAGEQGVVVYGEQCLSPQMCFTWQRWPAGK